LETQTVNTRYRNERHRAVANLLFTYNNIASRLQKILQPHNLTLQQFNVLRILERFHPEPVCNFAIREQLLDSRSDITRIVDRLIKEDLAIRKICGEDRRKVSITITSKGLELLDELKPLHQDMDGIMDMLDGNELEELNRLLEKIRSQLT